MWLDTGKEEVLIFIDHLSLDNSTCIIQYTDSVGTLGKQKVFGCGLNN